MPGRGLSDAIKLARFLYLRLHRIKVVRCRNNWKQQDPDAAQQQYGAQAIEILGVLGIDAFALPPPDGGRKQHQPEKVE